MRRFVRDWPGTGKLHAPIYALVIEPELLAIKTGGIIEEWLTWQHSRRVHLLTWSLDRASTTN
jgi:hypothetical protein